MYVYFAFAVFSLQCGIEFLGFLHVHPYLTTTVQFCDTNNYRTRHHLACFRKQGDPRPSFCGGAPVGDLHQNTESFFFVRFVRFPSNKLLLWKSLLRKIGINSRINYSTLRNFPLHACRIIRVWIFFSRI